MRYAALRALIALNLETAHRLAIGGLLADADVRIQALAAESVGRSSRDRAQALQAGLRGLLASANFHVRYQAALALGSHGDNAGVATMRIDQNTPNVKQSLMANKALTLLGAAPK